MIKYYVAYFNELFPCYLIKAGYIPCVDYRENKNDFYYSAYSQDQFCISNDNKKVFENIEEGKKYVENCINNQFNLRILSASDDRIQKLNQLKEIK